MRNPPAPLPPWQSDRPYEAEFTRRAHIDIAHAIAGHRRGRHDPAHVNVAGTVWRASRTPHGVVTVAIRIDPGRVRAAAWGTGAPWALEQLPRLWGEADDPEGFEPHHHPLVAELHARHRDLRIGRTDLAFDALASAIIEQKVTGLQAFGAWRYLLTHCGERAPGPTPVAMYAPPADWHSIPSWTWHRAGLEPAQSRTVVAAAMRRTSLERALAGAQDAADRERILTSIRGVGAWTSAETRIRAYGDPDAVSVGDYHLAHEIGYALTGRRTDDEGMRELLAPWRGHRQRVIALIRRGGPREPRRGARMSPEDHRAR